MNAIELLTEFSGESATQYEDFFRFSEEARLVGVEIHAVGTGSTTARYPGGEEALNEVNTILRFTTADGSRSHVERRVNDGEAEVVRRIYELYAAGHGLTAVAKRLNIEGVPCPRPQQSRPKGWSPSSVRAA